MRTGNAGSATTVTSPCIDAGDPTADWTGELWPHGGRINMGAYGGTPEASMSLSIVGRPPISTTTARSTPATCSCLADDWLTRTPPAAADIEPRRVRGLPGFRQACRNMASRLARLHIPRESPSKSSWGPRPNGFRCSPDMIPICRGYHVVGRYRIRHAQGPGRQPSGPAHPGDPDLARHAAHARELHVHRPPGQDQRRALPDRRLDWIQAGEQSLHPGKRIPRFRRTSISSFRLSATRCASRFCRPPSNCWGCNARSHGSTGIDDRETSLSEPAKYARGAYQDSADRPAGMRQDDGGEKDRRFA